MRFSALLSCTRHTARHTAQTEGTQRHGSSSIAGNGSNGNTGRTRTTADAHGQRTSHETARKHAHTQQRSGDRTQQRDGPRGKWRDKRRRRDRETQRHTGKRRGPTADGEKRRQTMLPHVSSEIWETSFVLSKVHDDVPDNTGCSR